MGKDDALAGAAQEKQVRRELAQEDRALEEQIGQGAEKPVRLEGRARRVMEHPLYQTGFFVIFSYVQFMVLELFFDVLFTEYSMELQMKNVALIAGINLLLVGIFHGLRTALFVSQGFFLLVGIANYFVILFRGYGIVFMDVYALGTAAAVAGNYRYEINAAFVAGVIGGLALLAAARVFLPGRKHAYAKAKYMLVSLAGIGCGLLFFLWIHMDVVFFRGVASLSWDHNIGMRENGYLLYFTANAGKATVEEPAGYSLERVREILNPYLRQEKHRDRIQDKKPNLIMIMNESFSDLEVLGRIDTNEPVMPFYDSLEENVIKGYAYSSVYGGYTANSEFEFLTGATKAFLPGNPYLQYLDGKLPNLVTNLKEQGYGEVIAMHPYKPSGYSRNRVYPLLGFDRFLSLEDFSQKNLIRGYVGDGESYKKMEELYQARAKDAPFCVFHVTMQNHNPYDDKDYRPDCPIKVTNFSASSSTEQYLSLMRESDRALAQLVGYFEQVEEPTVILLFGDHQPHLSDVFYQEVMGKKPDFFNRQEVMKKHLVPYMIWANYQIPQQEVEKISLNYLSKLLLEIAGLEMTAYDRFLEDVRKRLPSVSASGYYDQEGRLYQYEDGELGEGTMGESDEGGQLVGDGAPYQCDDGKGKEVLELLRNYEMVQYHYLFAGEERMEEYFHIR